MQGGLIDRVSIVREIGRGGFGCVYLVKDEQGNFYALKKVSNSQQKVYCKEQKPYEKELKSIESYKKFIQKENPENIIPILDAKIGENSLEYIMPLADGEGAASPVDENWNPKTLKSLVEARYKNSDTFTSNEVLEIFKPIFKAVDFLNKKGFLHRDIKPDNILFINSKPYLADIGLMRADTKSASVAGTPDYAPPTWYSKTHGNPDMWGLARTIYYFLSGNPPDTMGRPSYMFPQGKSKMAACDISAYEHFHRSLLRATREKTNERFFCIADFAANFIDLNENDCDIEFSDDIVQEDRIVLANAEKTTSIFTITGRINRKTFTLIYILLFLIINFSGVVMNSFFMIGLYIGYLFNWPLFAISIKRLHDAGKSTLFGIGMFGTMVLFRIINSIALTSSIHQIRFALYDLLIWLVFYFVYMTFKEQKGANRYGIRPQRLSIL